MPEWFVSSDGRDSGATSETPGQALDFIVPGNDLPDWSAAANRLEPVTRSDLPKSALSTRIHLQAENLIRTLHRPLRPRALRGALFVLIFGVHGALAQEVEDTWHFVLGAGAINTPRYPGSDDTFTRAVPVVSIRYGRYFLGGSPDVDFPFGLGAYLVQDERWRLGVVIGGDFRMPRRESDGPHLRGWGDIARTERGGIFGSYTIDWFTAHGQISSDIGGKREGVLASLDLAAKFSPIDGLTLSAGPGVIWGDSRYTQTFFGIDAGQSAIAGIPQYLANQGVNTVRFSVAADYHLTLRWALGARVTENRLRGDAAASPITTDKTQNIAGVFGTYRF